MTPDEINTLVAEVVMKGRYVLSTPWEKWDDPPRSRQICRLPNGEILYGLDGDWDPYHSIANAIELLAKFIRVYIVKRGDFYAVAVNTIEIGSGWDPGTARKGMCGLDEKKLLPAAICLAALRAMGVDVS